MNKNVGFISFRISGTDGVSLETMKWAQVLEDNGFNCFFMAGELDTPEEKSFISEASHFTHKGIKELYASSFDQTLRTADLTHGIHEYRIKLKKDLYEFIHKFNLDMLIPQNTLTIPLNVSLALAITEVIAETGIATIAHHHDFFWERKRFLRNCVWDYLNCAYPPHLGPIQHVVINSSAQNQLALRTGISSTLIPNVMDFDNPPEGIDEYTKDVRTELGVEDDELLILQPTRVVQRKGIEHAIELVARIGRKAALVISHASGDEGYEYEQRVMEFAEVMNIRALFVSHRIDETRRVDEEGRKIYTLQDIYPHADLVTYPSLVEGFGNAFLEAIYFRKPILVNNYSIYSFDIKPKGFDVIEMDNFISDSTIRETRAILDSPERIKQMTDTNYKLGLKYYSYTVLEEKLMHLMSVVWGKDTFCR
ncbi:MAG: glycosyltransferase family 4 protein [Spirochaetales bacterium]|nr:glycosyltransferase family 4 protein [Spirochaetales bacterium]